MKYHVDHRYPLKKVEESKGRVGEREKRKRYRETRDRHIFSYARRMIFSNGQAFPTLQPKYKCLPKYQILL